MTIICRLKRHRDEDPVEMLAMTCKRQKLEGLTSSALTFAGTADSTKGCLEVMKSALDTKRSNTERQSMTDQSATGRPDVEKSKGKKRSRPADDICIVSSAVGAGDMEVLFQAKRPKILPEESKFCLIELEKKADPEKVSTREDENAMVYDLFYAEEMSVVDAVTAVATGNVGFHYYTTTDDIQDVEDEDPEEAERRFHENYFDDDNNEDEDHYTKNYPDDHDNEDDEDECTDDDDDDCSDDDYGDYDYEKDAGFGDDDDDGDGDDDDDDDGYGRPRRGNRGRHYDHNDYGDYLEEFVEIVASKILMKEKNSVEKMLEDFHFDSD